MIMTSTLSSRARVSASKARPAASAPWSRSTSADNVRRAQMRNCSIAAARNVSPAASRTALPSALNLAASLPMVVVLPEPLTPMTRITNGRFVGSITSGRATGFERTLDLVRQDEFHFVRIDPALVAPPADRLANAGGGGEAEVGLDEHVLEIVERGGVELALGEDVGHAARDRRRRAREPEAQALKPALLRRRRRRRHARRDRGVNDRLGFALKGRRLGFARSRRRRCRRARAPRRRGTSGRAARISPSFSSSTDATNPPQGRPMRERPMLPYHFFP